jgi:hypothetical protein
MHSLQPTLGSSELSSRQCHALSLTLRSLRTAKQKDPAAGSTMEKGRLQEKTHL